MAESQAQLLLHLCGWHADQGRVGCRGFGYGCTAADFVWFDYWRPERQDLEALIGPLGLHPLSIEDCLDFDQIPKMDDYPNSTFILFNAFDYGSKRLCVDEIDLFVGKNFLVTVSGHNAGRPQPHRRRGTRRRA